MASQRLFARGRLFDIIYELICITRHQDGQILEAHQAVESWESRSRGYIEHT